MIKSAFLISNVNQDHNMDIKRSWLLPFIFLLASISSLVSSTKQNKHQRVIFRHDENECVCFKQRRHLHSIPNILDPSNKGIERLVIYAYRTEDGTIYSYLPNTVKQAVLPDLQYEDGDSISLVSNEQLVTIFTKSKKTIHYSQFGYSSGKINGFPIQNKKNKKSKHCDIPEGKFDAQCLNIEQILNNGIITQDFQSDVHQEFTDITQQSEGHKPINNSEVSHTITVPPLDGFQDPLYILPERPVPPAIDIQNTLLDGAADSLPKLPSDIANPPEVLNSGETFGKWFVDQMSNLNLHQLIKSPVNFGTLELLIRTALKEHGVFVSSTGLVTDSRGHILNMTNLHMRPLLIGDTLEYNKVIANPNGKLTSYENSAYLESLLIASLNPPKVITILPLGKVDLLKTFVLDQATIQDYTHQTKLNSRQNDESEGKTNVKLLNNGMETLVQNSSKTANKDEVNIFQNTKPKIIHPQYKNKRGKKMKVEYMVDDIKIKDDLSSKLKYLDHMISSPKHKKEMHFTSRVDKPNNIFGIGDEQKIIKQVEDLKQFGINQSQIPVEELVALLRKIVARHENDGGAKASKEDILKDVTISRRRQKVAKQNPKSSTKKHRGNAKTNNKKFKNLRDKIHPISVLKKLHTHVRPYIPRGLINIKNSVFEDSENNLEENHDFRIIGGAAATGSGFPISNRGRSGYPE